MNKLKEIYMKLYDGGTTVLIVIVIAGLLGYASGRFWEHDHPAEEALETVIEELSGVDLDLSPKSPDGIHHDHPDHHDHVSPK